VPVGTAPGSLEDRIAERLGQLLGPDFPSEIGLAVSGGGDSMAMLHLVAGWARAWGIGARVVTVDHGLRAESAAEAALVADEARGLGLRHDTLRWDGWDGRGNLPDAARQARLDLIGGWRCSLRHVLFAHTMDDQAETFLMRLRRGSGVEGLGAMAARREVPGGWQVVRPMLGMRRAELRHFLTVLRIPYVDDPTNDDASYDRVKMRGLLDGLEAEGLGRDTLTRTATRMRRAAEALGRRAHDVAVALTRVDHGDVVIGRDGFAGIEADTQLRIVAAAMQFVASAPYRPRAEALEAALERALAGGSVTLMGCRIEPERADMRVFREYAAVAGTEGIAGDGRLWDGRWVIGGAGLKGLAVRPLGPDGMAQAGDAVRAAGVPRAALESVPALFDGPQLVACRRIGFGPAYEETLSPPGGEFPARLIVH
jgi:tRNA(Ile)-lysidine synthase